MAERSTGRERLSVVIPCRNEEAYIERCVRSVLEADAGGTEVTVLVCDGRSDDGTRSIVERLALEHPQVRLIDNPERTTPHALNRGLQALPFEYGMILGAHAEIDRDYLRICVQVLRDHPGTGCAGGLLRNAYSDEVSRAIGAAMGHPFGVGNAHFRTGRRAGLVDTVAFGIYRREVFERVGWFDPDLVRNQDDEFSFRLTRAGIGIRFAPEATAVYQVRASFAKLYRQYRQYGYWKVYVNRKHRAVTTLRQLVPALWVLYLLLGGALALACPLLRGPWAAGVLLYLCVALYSATKAAPVAQLPRVLRAFWVLHMGYGIGYLHGILHFVLLGRGPARSGTVLTR